MVSDVARMTSVESQRDAGRGGRPGGGQCGVCWAWRVWERKAMYPTMEARKRTERDTRRRAMPMVPAPGMWMSALSWGAGGSKGSSGIGVKSEIRKPKSERAGEIQWVFS